MTSSSVGTRAASYDKTVFTPARTESRIDSLDLIRGVVLILMEIDHVRVYSGIPAGGPTPGIFFTRWVTHFCAPAFAFLAGTGAYLLSRKLQDTRALARFLATRGLLLVALELTVLHVAWTFTFDFTHLLAGVIWMLGWSMVLMAALVQLPVIEPPVVASPVDHVLMPRPSSGKSRTYAGGDCRAADASSDRPGKVRR